MQNILSIEKCPVPANTLLESFATNGAYADCYLTRIPARVSLPEFILAFYTTPLFKLERFILRWMVSKPSSDRQARDLADGAIDRFAAWQVENRSENELLMCDYSGRTRSWLMMVPEDAVDSPRTDLFFGSAVVPTRDPKTGASTLGWMFQVLLGFHRTYSVLLLHSARVRILRR